MKEVEQQKIHELPIEQIVPDKDQPRQEFVPLEMKRLADSIIAEGIHVPLVVENMGDGKYLLIDGERRYRVAKKVGLKKLPVRIEPAMSEAERNILRFHLQEQHASWTPWDKAIAIQKLVKSEEYGSAQEVANALGLPRRTVEGYLSISAISGRTAQTAMEKKIPFDMLHQISNTTRKIEDNALREKLEGALIDKVERGMFSKGTEFTQLRSAIASSNEPESIVKKLIEDKTFGAYEAMKTVGIYEERQLRVVYTNFSYLINTLDKMMSRGIHKHAEEKHVEMAKKLRSQLDSFIDNTGFTMPTESKKKSK